MTQTIIYDPNGNFQCISQRNDDGTVTCFGPGTNLWPDYIAQNGVPPPTGAPTNPTPPLPANVQTAIADFKNYLSRTPAQTQASLGISALQDGFNRDVIAALAYINSLLTK